jgi:hypothetical protein
MDEVITYATPLDVLRQVLGIHENDSRDITKSTVSVESAVAAIKAYHNQFLEAVPTSTLESKILKAKQLGIRFIKAQPTGQYQETPDAIIITGGLTTEGFEEELDEKIDYYNDRVFIDILKKHDLLK